MKSAFLVSAERDLFARVHAALVRMGATGSPEMAQLHDRDGTLLTVFGDVEPEHRWELTEPPFRVRSSVPPPDMKTAGACVVECRSERFVADVVRRLAAELGDPLWVLDDETLWLATEVEPDQLRL